MLLGAVDLAATASALKSAALKATVFTRKTT